MSADSFAERPAELLARLIRFDTTNPPGNERECIGFIEGLLRDAGLETMICASEEERPNLIARLRGRGDVSPLMLYGHVDVVPADPSGWSEPPFEGNVRDGYVWGRGALDMKGGVAMMLSALLRASASEGRPAGDVIFAALSDEEAGSEHGARHLVEHHAELFEDVRYGIGEFGGYTLHLAGRRFYPIQVAEKQTCQVRATVRGEGGHASLPRRGAATAKLGRLLQRLDRRRLPLHVTPVPRRMVDEIAGSLPLPIGLVVRQALNRAVSDLLVDVAGDAASFLDPLLHNTAVATMVHGGESRNVVPTEISVHIDGRLLPGQQPEEFLEELRSVIDLDVELEVVAFDEGAAEVDYGLFDVLSGILAELDAGATPIPMLLPAVTDGRFFSRLGIQTYGFLPLRLERDFSFVETIHAVDERVPVEALEFGTRAISELLRRYGTEPFIAG